MMDEEITRLNSEIGRLSVEILSLESSLRLRDMDRHDRLVVQRRKLVERLAMLYNNRALVA